VFEFAVARRMCPLSRTWTAWMFSLAVNRSSLKKSVAVSVLGSYSARSPSRKVRPPSVAEPLVERM
jgi:hypothetical protein